MIGQLKLFIVKKNLTKKILKIMKKVIIIFKVIMKKIKLSQIDENNGIDIVNVN